MRRREFIVGLAGAAAWPRVARVQAMPVIGFLHAEAPQGYIPHFAGAFTQGLRELGFVEGQNVAVEYRWANARPEELPRLAADLVRRRVTVIVAGGGAAAAVAAKAATSTIPIVLIFGSNPVSLGLIASLNRPGGNVTGVTFFTTELMTKRLGLLRELVPHATTVGYLADDPGVFASLARSVQVIEEMRSEMFAAASALGRQIILAEIGSDRGFDAAFAAFAEHRAGAVIVQPSPVFENSIDQIVSLAAQHNILTLYPWSAAAQAGGLMAYSADNVAAWRDGGAYVGKILKGAKPGDLPFVQATKFELVINLKTAKAIGLTIPETLLATADEVIQ
jgi:putative ABC transport system substrate-binding protein